MEHAEDIVEVRGLVRQFGDFIAVDSIDFDVRRGEILGFLGPNGAGKSTTISMLATVLKTTAGRIDIAGLDTRHDALAIRRIIGLVPQTLTADDTFTGRENLLMHADMYGVPRTVAQPRISELLAVVGLTEAADRAVKTYSGGMRKRLELIAGLIHRPQILILDEPTLGLDIHTRTAIWDYITRLKRELGMTVFLTTHYLEEAEFLCDRIIILDHGKIIAEGTPEQLKRKAGTVAVEITFTDRCDRRTELTALPGVDAVHSDYGAARLETPDPEALMQTLISAAAVRQWPVASVCIRESNLNDVFLRLVDSQQDMDGGSYDLKMNTIQNRKRSA